MLFLLLIIIITIKLEFVSSFSVWEANFPQGGQLEWSILDTLGNVKTGIYFKLTIPVELKSIAFGRLDSIVPGRNLLSNGSVLVASETDGTREFELSCHSKNNVPLLIKRDQSTQVSQHLTDCVTGQCGSLLGSCIANQACSKGLLCFAENATSFQTGNMSVIFPFLQSKTGQCVSRFSNEERDSALDPFSQLAGCVVTNCASRAVKEFTPEPSEFTQDSFTFNGTHTLFSFKLSRGRIGNSVIKGCRDTFVIMTNEISTTISPDSPETRVSIISLNLETGDTIQQSLPLSIWLHIVFILLGFVIIFPLGILLRLCNIWSWKLFPWIGAIFGIAGVVLISALNDSIDVYSPHSILGVTTSTLIFIASTYSYFENKIGSWILLIFEVFIVVVLLPLTSFLGYQEIFALSPVVETDSSVWVPYFVLSISLLFLICVSLIIIRGRKVLTRFQGSPSLRAGSSADSFLEEDDVKVSPLNLSFSNVSCTVSPRKYEHKTILKGATGSLVAGSFTGLMGISGAGKTTLLDILAGRLIPDSGSRILFNGQIQKDFKKVGYVLQQDCVHEYLTVFETLLFTASLISSSSITEKQRFEKVIRICKLLGLENVQQTRVGGPNVRGLSSGERRRVSIGLQMLKQPSLLLLDEPTSGLDSQTAWKILDSLKTFAKEGRTVVATIHQPSPVLFEMFDNLILLHKGCTMYSGPRGEASTFFEQYGKPVPIHWNPADWFVYTVENEPDTTKLQSFFISSSAGASLFPQNHDIVYVDGDDSVVIEKKATLKYSQSLFFQTELLTRRSFTLVSRDPQSLRFLAFQNLIFGIILGSLFSELNSFQLKAISQSNAMAILLAMIGFVTVSLGTYLGFQDRLVYERERKDRLYAIESHFCARLIVGIPLNLILALILIIAPYFWLGLKPDGGTFFFFFLTVFSVIFVFDSVVAFVSIITKDINSAFALSNFYMAISIFFSADIIPLTFMPVYYKWIYFVTPFSYAFAAAVLNQFQGSTNEWWITALGIPIRDKWINLCIAFSMGLLWRLITFIVLKRQAYLMDEVRKVLPRPNLGRKEDESVVVVTDISV